MTPDDSNAQVRWAIRQAALRQHMLKRLEGKQAQENGLILPQAQMSPEHYHIIYHVPKDEVSIPNFGEIFITAQEGYQKMFDTAQKAEPNVEYDEEKGVIGIETRLHGRADLWWIVMELAACIRSLCMKSVSREQQKRKMILVPEQA